MRGPFSVTGARVAGAAWVLLSLLCLGCALADAGPAAWVDAAESSALGGIWPMLTWLALTLGALPLACVPGFLYDAATGQGLFERRPPSKGL